MITDNTLQHTALWSFCETLKRNVCLKTKETNAYVAGQWNCSTFFFRKPGFAEISNYLIQPTIMRWWDAILAVINSDETGPCISMSEAGDYEKKSCLGSAKGLFVNKSMAPCSSPLISSSTDFLSKPLNVLSTLPLSTTMTSNFHCRLLPHHSDS